MDGPNGSGKTFVYRVLLASIHNEGHVTLVVASSGIVALLLQGRRTSHSAFKIPVDVHRDSLCNVNTNFDTAELIQAAKLIVWDEAPAEHRHCAEVVDHTFRNILQQAESPFGGKVIIFGGDFRQCPPVVARGSQPAIVGATLKRLVLWKHVQVLALTENMWLCDDLASRPYAEYIFKLEMEPNLQFLRGKYCFYHMETLHHRLASRLDCSLGLLVEQISMVSSVQYFPTFQTGMRKKDTCMGGLS